MVNTLMGRSTQANMEERQRFLTENSELIPEDREGCRVSMPTVCGNLGLTQITRKFRVSPALFSDFRRSPRTILCVEI